jgi:hypothetical protein
MEWVVTVFHVLLTAALTVGVLFSNTKTQHIAILIALIIILFGVRYNKGCFLTSCESSPEKPTLSDLEKAFYLQDSHHGVSDAAFEEIIVANLTFLHIVRIAVFSATSVLPINDVFQS